MSPDELQSIGMDDQADDADPQVFAVSQDSGEIKFNRRNFIELAAVASAGAALAGCVPAATVMPPTAVPTKVPTSAPTATQTPKPSATLAPSATQRPSATLPPTPVPTGKIKVPIAYVYLGQDFSFKASGSANQGDVVLVLGRSADGKWLYVEYGGGKRGWLPITTVDFPSSVDPLIVLTPAITPTKPMESPPGKPGEVPAGSNGINYQFVDGSGKTQSWTAPCGSPIPSGAICVCNCISVPSAPSCSCVAVGCSCDGVHYWYPN